MASGDIALMLLLSLKGKFWFLNETMSVYRKHGEGISNTHTGIKKIYDMNVLTNYFNEYTNYQFTSLCHRYLGIEIEDRIISNLNIEKFDQLISLKSIGELLIFKLTKKITSKKGISELINIVVSIDNNYVQHLCVMLISLFENNPNESFLIYTIHSELSDSNIKLLQYFVAENNQKIVFKKIDTSVFVNAPVTHHVSLATYYRFLIPKLLPDHVSKVLYLDADMVILDSIIPLYNESVSNYAVAACTVPVIKNINDRVNLLKLANKQRYFNAGVMLINLDWWRKHQVFDRSLEILNNRKEELSYWDQDVLNILFDGHWKELPSKFNIESHVFNDFYKDHELQLVENTRAELIEKPVVVHFTGDRKPWLFRSKHPFKGKYWYYLKKTPFHSYKPPDMPKPIFQRVINKLSRFMNTLLFIKNRA